MNWLLIPWLVKPTFEECMVVLVTVALVSVTTFDYSDDFVHAAHSQHASRIWLMCARVISAHFTRVGQPIAYMIDGGQNIHSSIELK